MAHTTTAPSILWCQGVSLHSLTHCHRMSWFVLETWQDVFSHTLAARWTNHLYTFDRQ